jgi:RimJ/RimL family protein N-acetyltransferase
MASQLTYNYPDMNPPSLVSLRPMQDTDLPILFEHQRDPETVKMSAFPARDLDAFMAHWAKVRANPKLISRTILFEGQVAGSIGSWTTEDWPGSLQTPQTPVPQTHREVGYGIGREFWGRGIATQALAAFLQEVSERPIFGYTAEHNLASMRVLEKCGFVRSGQGEGVLNIDGKLVTEIIFRLD